MPSQLLTPLYILAVLAGALLVGALGGAAGAYLVALIKPPGSPVTCLSDATPGDAHYACRRAARAHRKSSRTLRERTVEPPSDERLSP